VVTTQTPEQAHLRALVEEVERGLAALALPDEPAAL
jgi:hypothetical protein